MASGLAQRNGGTAGLVVLVAILLLGLGLRIDYAWEGREPVFDAASYAKIARNLDEGHGFTLGPSATQPASNYSPGLPLLAAGIYKATGDVHERLVRIALALFGTLSILFTYLIAHRLRRSMHRAPSGVSDASNAVAGLVGAAAVAIYPALLEYQGMLMGEPLAATLLAGAVLATLWASDVNPTGPSRGPGPGARWVVPGALLGGLALVRPEYLGVALLLAVVVFLRDRAEWRSSLAQAGILLIGVALVVAPWTIRNAIALDRFVPVSTGGGQVLFAGTYLPSDGNPEKVGAEVVERHPELFGPDAVKRLRLEQILAALAAQRYPGVESDKALARMGREQLWDDITEEPVEYAGFVAAKVGRIWSHGPREVMHKPAWEALHWVLILFGLLGLVVLAYDRDALYRYGTANASRSRWEALLLATIFISITAISALLVASPRRVLVMLPLVAALAGVGGVWLWTSLRTRRIRY
jgi:hypothetical protein